MEHFSHNFKSMGLGQPTRFVVSAGAMFTVQVPERKRTLIGGQSGLSG